MIALIGLPVVFEVISLFSITFPSFPLPAMAVEKRTIPLAVLISEP